MTAVKRDTAGTMADARLVETEVLVSRPKRFVREALVMPDGYAIDWFYVDTPPSVLTVPVTADGDLVMVRQYRHNLKRHTLEFPAGTVSDGEDLEAAVLRELAEETGCTLPAGTQLQHLGTFYSLPSETNHYTHMFVAEPVVISGPATGDAEIEKYFDMSVVVIPLSKALATIGVDICGTETVTALMLARQAISSAP